MNASQLSQVEMEEEQANETYIQKHRIGDLVHKLTLGLLREKPETTPRDHWAHMLRMELLNEKTCGNIDMMEQAVVSEVPGRLLVRLFDATKAISAEIVPKETIKIIIDRSIDLLACDRVSLFVHDRRIDMLVLNASNLDVPIRVKSGQGIAGHVFKTHETVNIPNCYKDDRFDQSFDKMSGYRTQNMLVMPIVDFEGECMGVLQAINKLSGDPFTHVDEILLENLTHHISVALRNSEIFRSAIVTSERANALLRMMQTLSQDLGAQSTILTIQLHASELVQADRCTMFLVDEGKQELWSVSTDSGQVIRCPKDKGIAGECSREGEIIAIPDAYEDPRFNQAIDQKTGYRTASILAVPVLRHFRSAGTGCVLAVIQMINKLEFDGEVGKFDEEDIQVMETFATFVAGKLEGTSLVENNSKSSSHGSEGANALSSHSDLSSAKRKSNAHAASGVRKSYIAEAEEEEEEEDTFH